MAGEGLDPSAAYVLRFNRELTLQLGRGVLEGSTAARSFSVDINQNMGDVYISGATQSKVFPQTAGGVEPTFQGEGVGAEAAFVAHFTADLSRHLQSTYLSDVHSHLHPVTGRRSPLIAVHPLSG